MPTTKTPAGGNLSLNASESQSLENSNPNRNRGFSKQNRLLSAREYKAVFDESTYKATNRHLLLLATPGQTTRLGLVVAKKHVRLAVQRNRLKRLLRESFRHHKAALNGMDIVALVKPGLWQQDNGAIRKIIEGQWQSLLKQKNRPINGLKPP